MLDFKPFKIAVAHQFKQMSKHQLYRTKTDRDMIWTTYLASFPTGTDPVFRKRTEHDCSCCRSFVKTMGNVVAIVDGKMVSIWDIEVGGPYQVVADALSALVKATAIDNLFLHTEAEVGKDKTFEQLLESVKTWQHFHINLPRELVVQGASIGSMLSNPQATHDVFLRGLRELTPSAITTVLELIAQNSLYRGEEHRHAVQAFGVLQSKFDKLKTPQEQDLFAWSHVKGTPEVVTRIRNNSIGTLLVNLSEGVDLESAVKSFEAMVAPANYKRPTALVTKAMIESARVKITELGLLSALERRYAVMTDITVNNVLFADRTSKAVMNGNVFDDLASAVPTKVPSLDKVEEMPIEKFIADVLPKVESVEVLFENQHINNLVSLVAPADPTAARLLKWDNGYSWDYNGGFADSITERVKRAGGSVSGDLCCRLAWYNHDDLDFHMIEPGPYEIAFTNKGTLSPSGGMLDVDMNAHSVTREPVENIFYKNHHRMREGIYKLFVHNFNKRENTNVGFEVEIDLFGTIYRFAYDQAVPYNGRISVAEFQYSKTEGLKLLTPLSSTKASKTVWGLATENFHKVNIALLSPNHWDGQGIGNRHYFFMLEGCANEGTARGFQNEYLRSDLEPHRKALELVGSKMQTATDQNQLSGLGFSSTKRGQLIVRVKGSFSRVLKVQF